MPSTVASMTVSGVRTGHDDPDDDSDRESRGDGRGDLLPQAHPPTGARAHPAHLFVEELRREQPHEDEGRGRPDDGHEQMTEDQPGHQAVHRASPSSSR